MTLLDKSRKNPMRPALPSLLLLLVSTFLTGYVNCETRPSALLTEGTYWTYSITNKSLAQGVGSYSGKYEYLENSKVQATVAKSNPSTFVIEERVESDVTVRGDGFFTQRQDYHTSLVITSTIDRQTLTYTTYKIRDEATGEMREDPSKKGKPATHFVPPSLSESRDTSYLWRGEELSCTVSKKNEDFQDSTISVIVLRYSGPKKLTTHLGVFRFEEYGTAEGAFTFEGITGLRILSSAKETAKRSSGACCSITVTNAENYTLQTTNLPSISKSPPQTATPSPTSPPSGPAPSPTQTTPATTALRPDIGPAASLPGGMWSLAIPILSLITIGLVFLYIRKTKRRSG